MLDISLDSWDSIDRSVEKSIDSVKPWLYTAPFVSFRVPSACQGGKNAFDEGGYFFLRSRYIYMYVFVCLCICVHACVYVCLCLHTLCSLHACIVRLFKSGSLKIDLRKVLFESLQNGVVRRGDGSNSFTWDSHFRFCFLYKNLYLQVTKIDDENESVVSQKRSFPRTYARVQPACSSISSILYLLMSIIRNDALLSRVKIALPPSLLPPPTGDEGNRRISWPSSTSPTRSSV